MVGNPTHGRALDVAARGASRLHLSELVGRLSVWIGDPQTRKKSASSLTIRAASDADGPRDAIRSGEETCEYSSGALAVP
jgi:hypothetical protein